jgi:hypothetical protein
MFVEFYNEANLVGRCSVDLFTLATGPTTYNLPLVDVWLPPPPSVFFFFFFFVDRCFR